MGITVSPDIAQEIMERLLNTITDIEIYIDDIVCFSKDYDQLTEFRQPPQVQSHLEMPRILVQLGHIQST